MEQKLNKFTPLAVLSISLILTSGMAINGTLPMIKEHLAISQTQSELLGTVPSFAVVFFVLASTPISAKIGMKKTVLTGLCLVAFGGALPILTPNSYGLILLGRLILGVGLGLYNSLSVSYINALFIGKQRSQLLGMRNSMESIGQMLLTFLAGGLVIVGWKYAYSIYLFALPVALFFWFVVPDVKIAPQTVKKKKRFSTFTIVSILFAASLVMNSIAIAVRFPALAIELKGANFNTSNYLAMMPILGVVSGFLFEKVCSRLKIRILYLAVLINIGVNVMIGFSQYSFALLAIGLLVSSIPVAWALPFLFNHIDVVSGDSDPYVVTSFVFVGCNLGVFSSPIIMKGIQLVGKSDNLFFPFYVFGILFTLILMAMIYYYDIKKAKQER